MSRRRHHRGPTRPEARYGRAWQESTGDIGHTGEWLPTVRAPDCTTSGQELLCGTGFLAMLSGNAGEDRHPIMAHHHWCPAAVCAACAATSCHGGVIMPYGGN